MTIKDILEDKRSSTKRAKLDQEFPSLANRMVHKIYRYRDYVIYHVIIPSGRSANDTTYDVILEIKTAGFRKGSAKLDSLPLRVFSNCPSFVFGYAHNYWKSGILCDWLLKKYNKKVTESAPTKPPEDPLERSVYLAVAQIHSMRLDDENIYKTTGKKLDSLREIENNVRTQEQIMNRVKEKLVREKAPDKKSKETPQEESEAKSKSHRPMGRRTKFSNNTKTTRTIKSVHTIRSTKTTKSTKKN